MEDDQILSRGYEKGWLGKQEAVRELLKRHPAWRPHIIWQRAEKLHLSQNISKRGQDRSHSAWSEHDNKTLLNFAGYKSPQVIAGMLHRSEAAVRCHLMLLGKSSRVHLDGFSRHRLAVDLHLGKKTVQRWIVEGLLEVRDPRITRESLDRLDKSGCFRAAQLGDEPARTPVKPDRNSEGGVSTPGNPSVATKLSTPSGKISRAQRVWAEVANSLGVPVETIKRLIANRVLRLYDPTITEKSLRDFCRHHGSLINYDFLNRETRDWLENSMGLVRASGESASPRLISLRKHACIVRQCAKGHRIRGNAFFRHIKKCEAKVSESS
ncbi:MAG: hypothetical protein DMG30_25955 [Acidobacteria bacterium]|nr:MAG: hypothetical protein DMG30_25955 [Acidobacteriota bacterium]PYY03195.1 MAG: hypothetical protein DMG69_32950 [Acidobacteriota bacterium]